MSIWSIFLVKVIADRKGDNSSEHGRCRNGRFKIIRLFDMEINLYYYQNDMIK